MSTTKTEYVFLHAKRKYNPITLTRVRTVGKDGSVSVTWFNSLNGVKTAAVNKLFYIGSPELVEYLIEFNKRKVWREDDFYHFSIRLGVYDFFCDEKSWSLAWAGQFVSFKEPMTAQDAMEYTSRYLCNDIDGNDLLKVYYHKNFWERDYSKDRGVDEYCVRLRFKTELYPNSQLKRSRGSLSMKNEIFVTRWNRFHLTLKLELDYDRLFKIYDSLPAEVKDFTMYVPVRDKDDHVVEVKGTKVVVDNDGTEAFKVLRARYVPLGEVSKEVKKPTRKRS